MDTGHPRPRRLSPLRVEIESSRYFILVEPGFRIIATRRVSENGPRDEEEHPRFEPSACGSTLCAGGEFCRTGHHRAVPDQIGLRSVRIRDERHDAGLTRHGTGS